MIRACHAHLCGILERNSWSNVLPSLSGLVGCGSGHLVSAHLKTEIQALYSLRHGCSASCGQVMAWAGGSPLLARLEKGLAG